jgi:hypothetical protein
MQFLLTMMAQVHGPLVQEMVRSATGTLIHPMSAQLPGEEMFLYGLCGVVMVFV